MLQTGRCRLKHCYCTVCKEHMLYRKLRQESNTNAAIGKLDFPVDKISYMRYLCVIARDTITIDTDMYQFYSWVP